ITTLAETLRLSPIVAQLLVNRGIREPGYAERFLATPFKGLHDPALLPGMPDATERVRRAIQQGERICVYGDYDVDGLTGPAILGQALRLVGGSGDFYVPHRLDEGYGLNAEALKQVRLGGASLVITVDCGISSIEEAQEARRLGLDLIITDHHEFQPTLP